MTNPIKTFLHITYEGFNILTIYISHVFLQKKQVFRRSKLSRVTRKRKVIYKEMEVLIPHLQSIGRILFRSC
jgi:hypothetical protein